jgi:Tfp pilus assembly protein FimT
MQHGDEQNLRGLVFIGERGRSLIEISAMLALLGVLAATTAPALSSLLQKYALRGAAQEIFAQLQRARMSAVMENHRFNVTVVDSTHYKVHDDTNSNGAVDTGETVTTLDITKNGPSVTLSPTGTTISFAPDATAPSYGNITVQGAGITHAVQVSRGGRMKIQ